MSDQPSLKTVCFTGDGFTPSGRFIHRFGWKNMAAACNLTVHSTVYGNTDILVASRDDTVKARKAAEKGVKVVTYDEFLDIYHALKLPVEDRAPAKVRGVAETAQSRVSLQKTFSGADALSIPL